MKTVWNIFGGFIAFLLCILLVVSLVLCPMVSFLTDSVDPANIVKIVVEGGLLDGNKESAASLTIRLSTEPGLPIPQDASFWDDFDLSALENVDLSALEDALKTLADSDIINTEELMEAVELPEGTQVDEEKLIENLTKSELVQTLVSTYATDIMDAAMGVEKDPELTKETVTELLKPHVNDLVEIVKESLPEGTKVNEEKITQTIETVVEEAMPELVETLPPAQDVAQSVVSESSPELQQLLDILKFIRTGKLRTACILLSAVLALLVFLFRLPHLSGLRWVGVTGLFGALLVGGTGFGLRSHAVLSSLQQAAGDAAVLVGELVSSLASGFISFAVIYGIAGLVLIVLGGVLHAVFSHH